MAPSFVTPKPLLDYPDASVSDFRLALSPRGKRIIFERQLLENGKLGSIQLYIADILPSSTPTIFLQGSHYETSSRPDWCWQTDKIALSVGNGIVVVGPSGADPTLFADTKDMIYPSWYASGVALAVMNNRSDAKPRPCTSVLAEQGWVNIPSFSGDKVWAGMPSVNPAATNQIAFAGQYIGSNTVYDQEKNYIWLSDFLNPKSDVRPLDKRIDPTAPFDPAYQGRAPWFSPDGKWVAFESNRADPNYKLYAIFLQESSGKNPPIQVTDISYDAVHPKWFPDGRVLAATLLQTPSGKLRGIYSLDVSSLIA